MEEFVALRRNCQIGAKAAQNIRGSLTIFEKLCGADKFDHVIVGSLFCSGVIRYAKPFSQTKSADGDARYPSKLLSDAPGFSTEKHEQIILLRNTLIAHDDFTKIEPRLLFMSINPSGTDFSIPMSIAVANKCISHPSNDEDIQAIKKHVSAAFSAITNILWDDIAKLRALIIDKPSCLADAPYKGHYGTVDIPTSGIKLDRPDFSNDPWLVPTHPDFSLVQNGFRYEQLRVQRDFNGPEVIKLPNGDEFHISPREGGSRP